MLGPDLDPKLFWHSDSVPETKYCKKKSVDDNKNQEKKITQHWRAKRANNNSLSIRFM